MLVADLLKQINDAVAADPQVLSHPVRVQVQYDRYNDATGTLSGHIDGGHIIEEFYKTNDEKMHWAHYDMGFEFETNDFSEYLNSPEGQSYKPVFVVTANE